MSISTTKWIDAAVRYGVMGAMSGGAWQVACALAWHLPNVKPSIRRIEAISGLANGTVKHHMRFLQKIQLVRVVQVGGDRPDPTRRGQFAQNEYALADVTEPTIAAEIRRLAGAGDPVNHSRAADHGREVAPGEESPTATIAPDRGRYIAQGERLPGAADDLTVGDPSPVTVGDPSPAKPSTRSQQEKPPKARAANRKQRRGGKRHATDADPFAGAQLPLCLDASEVHAAWGRYLQHRREQGNVAKLTRSTVQAKLDDLATVDPGRAAELIDHAIRKGWTDIIVNLESSYGNTSPTSHHHRPAARGADPAGTGGADGRGYAYDSAAAAAQLVAAGR